jgi:hypothetical protein
MYLCVCVCASERSIPCASDSQGDEYQTAISAVGCCAFAIIGCVHDGVYGLTCRRASVDDKGDCAYLVDGSHRQRPCQAKQWSQWWIAPTYVGGGSLDCDGVVRSSCSGGRRCNTQHSICDITMQGLPDILTAE